MLERKAGRAAAIAVVCGVLGGCRPAAGPGGGTGTGTAAVAATSAFYAYEKTKVAEGVYAFVLPGPRGQLVSGNTLVVIGDDGVLVVDTGHFPSLARAMIADIRALTDKPVRYVVNTHWHSDHVFGNATYREAFPGVVLLAHAETRRLALKNNPKHVEIQRDMPQYIRKVREALARGTTSRGEAITAKQRMMVTATLPELEQTVGDADVVLEPPQTTFDGGGITVNLGKREVRVMHLGRGNTAGDVVVYVPDAKVVATGDLVVAPTPYAYGSYLSEWSETLKKVEATGATTILPGHGPVEHDWSYVHTLEAMIASVRAQVDEARKAGLTLEQTQKKVDLSSYRKQLAGDDALKGDEFDDGFTAQAVERAYQEAEGKLAEE